MILFFGGLDSNDRRQTERLEHNPGLVFVLFCFVSLLVENRDNEKTVQIFLTDQFSMSPSFPECHHFPHLCNQQTHRLLCS